MAKALCDLGQGEADLPHSLQCILRHAHESRALRSEGGVSVALVKDGLVGKLRDARVPVRDDEPLDGYQRVYVDDPFGNRIELMEPDS